MADPRQQQLLAMLPIVAVTMARRRTLEPSTEDARWWVDFRAAVPAPVWRYVLDLDPDIAADATYWLDPDAWLTVHHPALEHVIEGAHDAFHGGLVAPLRHVQGVLLKWSTWRLAWALAREQAAGKTAARYDDVIGDHAAQSLLGWTHRESNRAWLEPERFIARWQEAGTDDPDILAKAGLHRAELELLDAEGE